MFQRVHVDQPPLKVAIDSCVTIPFNTRIPRRQINEKERIEENPHFLCENWYNIQFAFCDELKAYITGFVRSGNTYTANGAAEMIKEIVAHIKTDDLEILFRMDSGYSDDVIIEAIESAGCKF